MADDMLKYGLQILAIQETHMQGTGVEEIRTSTGKRKYNLFYTGADNNKHHGVGIIAEKELDAEFRVINDRICMLTTKIQTENNTRELAFISTYAHTLVNSEKKPELREEFYEALDRTISNVNNRALLVIGGDFNAKTGTGYENYKENMGKYGKGMINTNGEHLLEMAAKNELLLANTMFYHKKAHRTTWVCPERRNEHRTAQGEIRRNPYRNQIDYVIVKKDHKIMLQDARSYSGIETNTDHRLVKTTMKIEWYKVFEKKNKEKKLNLLKLKTQDIREKYQTQTKLNYEEREKEKDPEEYQTPQEQWNNITNACLTAAKEILGSTERGKRINDERIQELSEHQKKLRNDMNATSDKEKRNNIRKERNKVLSRIHKIRQEQELNQIEEQTREVENSKSDSTQMYKAVRVLSSMKPKKKLVVDGENGLAIGEKEQAAIITKYFKSVFSIEGEMDMEHIEPCEMTTPFTGIEITKAIASLKNNKSAGCDNIKAELLKYSSRDIHEGIAATLNNMARTGEYPIEVKTGILVPLPKPGKPQGPPKNLRPVILLSILRKILAICLIRRVTDKLNSKIPLSQAAYREGRSTTEHVFTFKILAEKAITSSNYKIHLLMLDMSKAFDTMRRETLMKDLRSVLDRDELHLMYILLKDVQFQVRAGSELGEPILTNIGGPQGDCLSALLFTFYLAKSLEDKENEYDHCYAKSKDAPTITETIPAHLQDHIYMREIDHLNIDQQYADDTGWATTNPGFIEYIKKTIPARLLTRNLGVNVDKTEEYTISKDSSEEWKSCKYLGSLLDTKNDIKRRTGLAIDAFNKLKHFFTSKHAQTDTKIRIFNAFVSSIFLYNSELWTTTSAINHKIDVLQRSFLRRILDVRRRDRVRNVDVYERTRTTPWSITIKRRRLSWFGHLLRLQPETPARQALNEFYRRTKRPQGRPTTTWISQLKKDLLNIADLNNLDHVTHVANDRPAWRSLIECAMSTDGERI